MKKSISLFLLLLSNFTFGEIIDPHGFQDELANILETREFHEDFTEGDKFKVAIFYCVDGIAGDQVCEKDVYLKQVIRVADDHILYQDQSHISKEDYDAVNGNSFNFFLKNLLQKKIKSLLTKNILLPFTQIRFEELKQLPSLIDLTVFEVTITLKNTNNAEVNLYIQVSPDLPWEAQIMQLSLYPAQETRRQPIYKIISWINK